MLEHILEKQRNLCWNEFDYYYKNMSFSSLAEIRYKPKINIPININNSKSEEIFKYITPMFHR
jgi:hypothetical protein